jgi:hypothetical protein
VCCCQEFRVFCCPDQQKLPASIDMDSFLLSSADNRRNKISNAGNRRNPFQRRRRRRKKEEAKPNTQPTVSQLKQAKSVVVARQRKSLGSHRSSEVCDIRPRPANNKQDLQGMMCVGKGRERERAANSKQSMRDASKVEHAIARQRREKERQRERSVRQELSSLRVRLELQSDLFSGNQSHDLAISLS